MVVSKYPCNDDSWEIRARDKRLKVVFKEGGQDGKVAGEMVER